MENANEVSEGIASEFLLSLLEVNLPKSGKKNKITLGVADKNLAGAIKAAFPGLECETGETSEIVQELLRGIRQHAHKLLKQLQEGDVERANLGLGVRLPICDLRLSNRGLMVSSMLIPGQGSNSVYRRTTITSYVSNCTLTVTVSLISSAEAIATLDNLDKAINLFS